MQRLCTEIGCLRTQYEQKLIHTMLCGASKRKLYMSLAKPIDRDTDNGWPKNNEVDVYRAPLRRVCFGVVSRRGSRGCSIGQEVKDTSRWRDARDIATTVVSEE
jgi:hypothetical protein